MSNQDTFCIVARAEGMFPSALGGYERHRTRSGGDTGDIDPSRTHLNTVFVGEEDWMRTVQVEIDTMRMENFELELSKLRKRRRTSELRKRLVEGSKDPWRGTRHGPMREILLTANAKWFAADPTREKLFEARAIAWLQNTFGEDLVHARCDRDEQAYHIHSIILPRVKTVDGRHMLQPSKFDVIRKYELLQNSVGEWFADIGLQRGERNAAARRKARAAGKEPPPKPRHTRPRAWRLAEENRLIEKLERLQEEKLQLEKERRQVADQGRAVKQRQDDVEAAAHLIEGLAVGDIDVAATGEGLSIKPANSQSNGTDRIRALKQGGRFFKHVASRVGKAWLAMRDRAQAAAEAELARDHTLLEKARETLTSVSQHLTPAVKQQIARGLAVPLSQLRRNQQERIKRRGKDR